MLRLNKFGLAAAFALPEAVVADDLLQTILPALGQIDAANLAVDDKVAPFFELIRQVVGGLI